MNIDITIHSKSFSYRLFIMFKYLAEDVNNKVISKNFFIAQWINVIERLHELPDLNKKFWEIVHSDGKKISDMDSVFDRFSIK